MSGNDLPQKGPFGSKDRFFFPNIYRNFDCDNYDACLDIACNANWKVFTCEGCSQADYLELIPKGDDE
jgi:hypothetical protein